MTNIGRRGAIGLIGAAASLAATRAPAATGEADRLRTYMRMRGALDDRLVIGWIDGRYSGIVDGEPTPLYGVVAATFARHRARPGGGFEAVTWELAFFTDLATGKVLSDFRNPYTGETVTVPAGGQPAAKIAFLPDLSLKIMREMPGFAFDHQVLPFVTSGDDLWITEVTRTAAQIPGQPRPFRYNETTILHARRSDLAGPAKRVPCQTTFNGVVSWRPWLMMGDRPGHLLGVGAGVYGAKLEALPPAWLAATRERRPELFKDPAAVLEPLWSKS
ncbi:DUF1838 family protein [Glacieibacterium frigidum]|uniref:DUF1838 domain-containing protein n=1 Tax=Glacieibacterium frigidum TaxID=2593303 RepID=A0A552U8A2_9SPHN|nr:DUF1838 family protein [Glacieibacterium frigidum]TRW14454.1 DUF1838 domain-containing protein [Glacieibacterium frigidum]